MPRVLGILCLGLALSACSRPGAVAPTAPPATALRLCVSATGDDGGDGRTAATAFRTIGRARDEVRALKAKGPLPDGGIEVGIAGGTYPLTAPLVFTAEDSGTERAPITYQALPGQEVDLVGGRVLDLSAFAKVEDPSLLARLDPAARGQVRQASVEALGLAHAGPFPAKFDDSGGLFELFWNGRRLPLSRWPNEGWSTMKRAVTNGDDKTPGLFEYRDERPAHWLSNPSIWLKGQWRVPWEEPALRVGRIDPSAHTIEFAVGLPLGIGNKYTRPAGNGQEPWCALNLVEEIDRPGEWCVDFPSRTLYFWPPDEPGRLLISQLAEPMIQGKGAAHLRFVGLTLEASLGHGFAFENSESNEVAGCTLRNLARFGVLLEGWRSTVRSCDMHDLGAGCVMVSGGDEKNLVPSGNLIANNHLHDYGKLKAMYSAAVDVGFGGLPNAANHKVAVGVRVEHNLIHDGPRDAVLVSGQDNVFEKNEIFRCGFASDDLGAFYSWCDWTIRGIVIRHNYIHDTVGGVNPDDGASGSLIEGNIFAGPRTGVWIASGPDHTIRNNIFIKYDGPVLGLDDRGQARGYAKNPRLIQPLQKIQPTREPWSKRFPEVTNLLESRPELPLRNRFLNNLVVIQKGEPVVLKMSAPNKADPALFSQSGNYITAGDPGFLDVAAGRLGLRPDSEVFRKIPGFEPIPFEEIGLRLDAYRTTLPSDEAIRRPHNNPMFDQNPNKHFGTL